MYIIASIRDPESLSSYVNSGGSTNGLIVRQIADIDFGFKNFNTIGSGRHPFAGTFDGNSHVISNVVIDNEGEFQGLIGCLASLGNIRNVTLTNANVIGTNYVGGIAGFSYGIISGCIADNVKVLSTRSGYAGGVVGYSWHGIVTDCLAVGVIAAGEYKGAVAGANTGGTVGGYFYGGALGGIGYNKGIDETANILTGSSK